MQKRTRKIFSFETEKTVHGQYKRILFFVMNTLRKKRDGLTYKMVQSLTVEYNDERNEIT